MNDEEKKDKITHIDEGRVRRLETRAHYNSLLQEFDVLRAKLIYDNHISKEEAHRLVTLIKYFLKNPYSEAFKIQVQYLYDKYIKDDQL